MYYLNMQRIQFGMKRTMDKEKLEIGLMKDDDVLKVYSIEKNSFSDIWSEETYKSYKEDKGRSYYVAYLGVEVVAFCVSMQVLDECEILKIAVDKKNRGKGIGEALIRKVMKEASEKGVRFFYLEVRESNSPAITLYKKVGFTESGRRADYYRNPKEDAVLMSCVL